MTTSTAVIISIIGVCGAVGGLANAFLSDNGFILPTQEKTGETCLWRPGYLGNVFVSTLSALISWGLYGPIANQILIPDTGQAAVNLSIAHVMGALLTGVAGARWLTNEVDKNLMKAAVSVAAASPADQAKAAATAGATPIETLRIVKDRTSLANLPDQP